ncbi:FKBP-type peptidyl-prolyl cis-trans isomerase [Aquisphaera giovannonii]|uniref:FKBP-type peptidyl-prolyl cis-trans isomerase n=1 Tax=Aquisphaera giovannonii TaxID=406548 RepID=UPI001FE86FE9|nr:FKBP-type peptidyl-prolyl cis-trans isomerase [Aquisphaera giovannonii]
MPTTPPGAINPKTLPAGDEGAVAVGESAVAAGKTGASAVEKAKAAQVTAAPPTAKGETKTTVGGVKYETLKEGTGDELKGGHVAQVHYVGTLPDGTVFDSSRKKGEPLPVTVGAQGIIKGWNEGLPGMKVGEIRKLLIPSKLAYGERGFAPQIPPNTDLTFEIELLKILY